MQLDQTSEKRGSVIFLVPHTDNRHVAGENAGDHGGKGGFIHGGLVQ